ncbi:Cyclin-dependent kinase 2 [Phytophthora nicotianae]|uniref:Cyclin-dependent kinase 2 n=1 Tax=Phytophthora nicotianae TaxID=4792 RepID=A0A0W8DG57_PHYNI|nr:Cyclin-dependent kinase 2 [Phytophthora nicotianae]
MAKNLGFARGGTSSWADDDDVDFQPLPATPRSLPPRGYNDRYDDRRGGRRGGHEERRGGYEERRRDSRDERPKNPVPDVGPWKGIRDIRFPRDHDNRLKGFAYVEFDEREQLVRALDLDGQKLDGRHVKMDVALDRERKPRDNGWYDKRSDRSNDRRERTEAHRERQRLTLLPRSTSSEKKKSDAHKPSIFGDAKPRDESAYLERKAKAKADVEAKALARKNSHDEGRGGRGRGRGDRRPTEGGRGRGKENTPARKSDPRPKRTEPPTTKISAPAPAKTANVFDLLNDSDSDSD